MRSATGATHTGDASPLKDAPCPFGQGTGDRGTRFWYTGGNVRRESCNIPAGESPVRVIAGEPGSRLRLRGETPVTKRSIEVLQKGGGDGAGRNKVNASASSDFQPKGVREGRAGITTAKAIDSIPEVRMGWWTSPGYGRRHVTKEWCGTRETLPGGQRRAKTVRIRCEAEIVRSREGVRGVHSTDESGEKPSEGRDPALVVLVRR